MFVNEGVWTCPSCNECVNRRLGEPIPRFEDRLRQVQLRHGKAHLRGLTVLGLVQECACPACSAPAGAPCLVPSGRPGATHRARVEVSLRAAA